MIIVALVAAATCADAATQHGAVNMHCLTWRALAALLHIIRPLA
jgi:hypothetical protein